MIRKIIGSSIIIPVIYHIFVNYELLLNCLIAFNFHIFEIYNVCPWVVEWRVLLIPIVVIVLCIGLRKRM